MNDSEFAKMMAFIELVVAGNDSPTDAQVSRRVQKNSKRLKQ